ncbi:MAG: methionyl-tRNA formyltransferase, partial [Anaerolineales bacterium]
LNLSAAQLARQIRAYEPSPGSYLQWNGRRLLVRAARAAATGQARPGQVFELDQRPAIGTGDGALVLERVQLEGKRSMDGQSFLHGRPDFLQAHLLG